MWASGPGEGHLGAPNNHWWESNTNSCEKEAQIPKTWIPSLWDYSITQPASGPSLPVVSVSSNPHLHIDLTFFSIKWERPLMNVCFLLLLWEITMNSVAEFQMDWLVLNASVEIHSPPDALVEKSLFFPFLESTHNSHFMTPSIIIDGNTTFLNLRLFLSISTTMSPTNLGGSFNSHLLTLTGKKFN